jgi:hypothetical protein
MTGAPDDGGAGRRRRSNAALSNPHDAEQPHTPKQSPDAG